MIRVMRSHDVECTGVVWLGVTPRLRSLVAGIVAAIALAVSAPAWSDESEDPGDAWVLHAGDNEELLEMFSEDQAIRQDITLENFRERMPAVSALDHAHRARLLEIVGGGSLKTGYDYFRASVLFQHQTQGGDAGNVQLALELGLASMALGCPEAPGIVARAYDRFLGDIGRGQRFGTQGGATGERKPIDAGIVPMSDEIRALMQIDPVE